MKITLHPLFAAVYAKGYLRTSKDGRKRLDLVNSKTDRTTISYARYLVSCRENRFLNDNEEVDHDDNDKSNDSDSNLILRTVKEHLVKTLAERKPATLIEFVCPVCQTHFKRRSKGKYDVGRVPCCSRSCNGKRSKQIQMLNPVINTTT